MAHCVVVVCHDDDDYYYYLQVFKLYKMIRCEILFSGPKIQEAKDTGIKDTH